MFQFSFKNYFVGLTLITLLVLFCSCNGPKSPVGRLITVFFKIPPSPEVSREAYYSFNQKLHKKYSFADTLSRTYNYDFLDSNYVFSLSCKDPNDIGNNQLVLIYNDKCEEVFHWNTMWGNDPAKSLNSWRNTGKFKAGFGRTFSQRNDVIVPALPKINANEYVGIVTVGAIYGKFNDYILRKLKNYQRDNPDFKVKFYSVDMSRKSWMKGADSANNN